jgi:hypothetical protein
MARRTKQKVSQNYLNLSLANPPRVGDVLVHWAGIFPYGNPVTNDADYDDTYDARFLVIEEPYPDERMDMVIGLWVPCVNLTTHEKTFCNFFKTDLTTSFWLLVSRVDT